MVILQRPQGVDKTYAELFREVLDDETKLMLVGGVFGEEAARDAVENYGDLIAVGRGTLVDPLFAEKVMLGQGDTILSEVSPETLDYIKWTPGLFESIFASRFSRFAKNSWGRKYLSSSYRTF